MVTGSLTLSTEYKDAVVFVQELADAITGGIHLDCMVVEPILKLWSSK